MPTYTVALFRDVTIRQKALVTFTTDSTDPAEIYDEARQQDDAHDWQDTADDYDILSEWGEVTDEAGQTHDIDKDEAD